MKTSFPALGSGRTALFAGVAALALPGAAIAQDATPNEIQPEELAEADIPDDEDNIEGIEEQLSQGLIVVTATKREQTLQDVPVSVSVTTAETIERAQIRDLIDLQTVTPSLRANQLQSSANTTFIIRGFGNGANNVGIEPSVGVFIDGVFRSRSAGQIGDLANVSRIEVLRGPQSTLFGKNASAGVISVITREPQFDFGGSVSATYGNFDQVVLKADLTGPLTETIAVSVDGNYNTRDGYVDVPNLGIKINDRDRYSVRGQVLFEPSDAFKLRAIGDYSKIDELCCYAGNIVAGPTVPLIFAVGGQVGVENIFEDETFLNIEPVNEIESYGGSLQGDLDLGGLTFTSISAYRELRSFNAQDVDFTSADIVNQITDQSIDTFTQELRVSSDFDGFFNFLLGGFYFDESVEQTGQLITGPQSRGVFDLLAGGGVPGTLSGVEFALGLPQNSIFAPGLLTDERFTLDNQSYSIFGTVDLSITDRLTLTAGFNYTDDEKDFSINTTAFDPLSNISLVDAVIVGQIAGALGIPPSAVTPDVIAGFQAQAPDAFAQIAGAATNPAFNPLLGLTALQFQPQNVDVPNAIEDGRTDDDDFSYTLRASYEFTPSLNAYFTYATGFKASSVNLSRDSRPLPSDFTPGPRGSVILAPSSPIRDAGLIQPNLTTGTRFAGPEEAEVYELGLKAQFDGLGFNLALFDQTLEGFQSFLFTGTGFALANAGEQSTKGFELDTTIVPDPSLIFTFALTYLDAVYDSFPNSVVGDLTGQRPGNIPEFVIATSATYTHEFGNSGNLLIGRIDYNHESNTELTNGLPTFGPAAETLFRTEANLVNTALTLVLDNGLEIGAYARNLLDDRYLTTVFDGVAQAGTVSGYPNQPRTYGGTVRFRF